MSTHEPAPGDVKKVNPYAAPTVPIEFGIGTDVLGYEDGIAAVLRSTYRRRELAIKGLGWLLVIGGLSVSVPSAISALVGIVMTIRVGDEAWTDPDQAWLPLAIVGTLLFVISLGAFLIGSGLVRLRPSARGSAIVIATLLVVAAILLTVVAFFGGAGGASVVLLIFGGPPYAVLYLMMSPESTVVFSEGYREVIRRTSAVDAVLEGSRPGRRTLPRALKITIRIVIISIIAAVTAVGLVVAYSLTL